MIVMVREGEKEMADTIGQPGLAVRDLPAEAPGHPGHLSITGLVAHPVTLTTETLASVPRLEQREAFTRKDGTPVERRWRGIPLPVVLALAEPLAEARYVRVCAGTYALPVALQDMAMALLCDELDGQPLSQQMGAPWRLLLPGSGGGANSVKWIDRLEVTEEPGSYDATCPVGPRG
jgi:DMSO/TMAO reductase YedYZ molybdopterin-dependent catalytic subunit